MSLLGVGNHDDTYDSIDDNSPWEDKLNAAIKKLKENSGWSYIDYHLLLIPHNQIDYFDSLLVETTLVDRRNQPSGHDVFKLSPKGQIEIHKHGTYFKYIFFLRNAAMEEMKKDELWLMNTLLAQLNTKTPGYCHSPEEVSIATGIDTNTVNVLCKKIDKLGHGSYHQQCITINDEGKYKADHGGYKRNEISLSPIKVDHIGDVITTHGEKSPISKSNLNQQNNEGKLEIESPESIALRAADLENKNLNNQLLKLQIKEAKNKKVIGLIAFIGGAVLTNVKDIWHLVKTWLHI